jgi:peptidoglycan/LPS O-acetylase OafA/YrhL
MTAALPEEKVVVANKPARLVGLDGLRGILALCIIITHVTGALSPKVLAETRVDLLGQAVVVFFALSGFLIYRPFMSRIIDGRPQPGLRTYFRLRVFRIFPAYLVIFLIANFALHAVFLTNAVISSQPRTDEGTGVITAPLNLLAQLTLVQNYIPSLLQTGINASWTLTAEIAFYALLPFVSMGAARLRTRTPAHPYRAALAPAVVLVVVGILVRTLGTIIAATHPHLSLDEIEWGPTGIAVLSRSILTWCDAFGLGMIAAVVIAAVRAGELARIGRLTVRQAGVIAFGIGLVGAAVAILTFEKFIGTAVAFSALALIVLLIAPTPTREVPRLSRAVDWAPLRYLGTISLSIYLWHYPVLLLFTRLHLEGADTLGGAAWNFVAISVATVALASVTYWLVERPALTWRPRSEREPRGANA